MDVEHVTAGQRRRLDDLDPAAVDDLTVGHVKGLGDGSVALYQTQAQRLTANVGRPLRKPRQAERQLGLDRRLGLSMCLRVRTQGCGPCRQLSPILDELAGELTGRVTIAKMNIDQNPEAPTRYNVRAIPTMILFKDGKPLATKAGGMPKGQLKEWIESQIA